ncbi:MAG: tetratricopeptide repeat protein [Acidobacteriota bacterium]|nr:tetratricopeptide repeat protein [Acidobacteriota bacterium]
MPTPCNSAALLRLSAVCLFAALTLSLPAQDFSHPDTPPDPSAALVQQANDALAAGDLPSALKILINLNAKTPHNAQVLYDLGLTLEALESSPASQPPPAPDPSLTPESCYRQAIAADATFPAPHVALGLLLARTNRSNEAHTALLAATTFPGIDSALKARAFRALAKLDQQSRPPDPTAASGELLAALKLTSEQPDDVLLSAEIAEAAADLAAAEQAYRRYLGLPGNAADPRATAALAHVLLAEHHPAEAEALLAPALAHSPNDPSFTAQLANAYLASGDPAKIAKATPLVESLHAKDPADTNITRLLARIYAETGRDDQADPLYSALIAARPDSPDATLLDDRAQLLLRLHRPGEAEKLLKQAVANPAAFPSPDAFAEAAMRLAIAAEEIDDPRSALQALALRATVQQSSPSSLFLEATANDELHQTTQAVDLYKQFLAAAHGALPDQELRARERLAALQHRK